MFAEFLFFFAMITSTKDNEIFGVAPKIDKLPLGTIASTLGLDGYPPAIQIGAGTNLISTYATIIVSSLFLLILHNQI